MIFKTHICAPRTATKAREIAERMRREYPWSQYAADVRAVASNYSFLMGRLKTINASADAPMFEASHEDGFTSEDVQRYWHRELGHVLIDKLIEEGLCRISVTEEGPNLRYRVELAVVRLEKNETLFQEGDPI